MFGFDFRQGQVARKSLYFLDLRSFEHGHLSKSDLPFWKAKSAEAAGTLAPDGLSRAVFIMDGAMRAGTVLADLVLKESQSPFHLVHRLHHHYVRI